MADAPTIPQLIADLKRAFPRERIPTETLAIFVRELADVDPAVLDEAVRTIIRGSRYFPTIAEIRDVAASRVLGLPDEAEALAQADRYSFADPQPVDCPHPSYEEALDCRRCQGTGVRYTVTVDIHPLVREALDLVGGRHGYRTADEPSVVRGQFLRLYRSLRDRAHREAMVGEITALPPGVPRLELRAPPL